MQGTHALLLGDQTRHTAVHLTIEGRDRESKGEGGDAGFRVCSCVSVGVSVSELKRSGLGKVDSRKVEK